MESIKEPLITHQFQVKFLLFCSRTHRSVIRYYKRLHESTQAFRKQSTGSEPEAEVYLWDWRGVPEMWPPIAAYGRFSTAWMVLMTIKTLVSEQLFEVAHLLTGNPGHCVILGRLVMHPTISALAAFVFATFHVVWRCVQHHMRAHMMSMFVFLLQSERDLEQFYALMRANHRGDYLGTGTGNFRLRQQHHELSAEESFFRHLLCYEVHLDDGRVLYRLRPNRKCRSHAYLVAQTRLALRYTSTFLLVLAIPITISILLVLLSDLRYVQTFPGCSPTLDYLYTSGQLTSFWSWTFTWHRAWAFVFDFIENWFIGLDSGFALTFVVVTTYLMNHDLLLYWRHLNARIELNLARVRLHYEHQEERMRQECRGEVSSYMPRHLIGHHSHRVPRLPARKSARYNDATLARERKLIDVELNELQCELFDFFRQVERADGFISDVMSTIVLVWLTCVAGPNYFYLTRVSSAQLPAAIRFIQVLGLFSITLSTHYLLALHSSCRRSYELISSLMAYDQSTGSTRLKFLQVVEFFTERKATTYTLFQRIPYLKTTYIKIIGWSFSSMVICNALFGRERYLVAGTIRQQADNMSTSMSATPNVMILGGSKYSAFASSL